MEKTLVPIEFIIIIYTQYYINNTLLGDCLSGGLVVSHRKKAMDRVFDMPMLYNLVSVSTSEVNTCHQSGMGKIASIGKIEKNTV